MKTLTHVMPLLVIAPLLTNCGQKKASSAEGLGAGGSVDNPTHFNLAEYTKKAPQLKQFASYAAADNSYLSIGDQNFFQIQTNFVADTTLSADLNKTTGSVEYWLDGYIFNKQLVGSGAHGQILDIQATSVTSPLKARGSLRFLGQTLLAGDITSSWSQAPFTRDLGDYKVPYNAIPMLGLELDLTMGGTFNVRGDIDQRDPNTMMLSFVPSIALNATIDGKIKLLKFISADINNQLKMLESQFAASTTLGYYPDLKMVVGSIGIDSGNVDALKNLISIGANVDAADAADNVLPEGVDTTVWKKIINVVTESAIKWHWQHVIYQPKEPLFSSPLQPFAAVGQTFTERPATMSECDSRVAAFQKTVDDLNAKVEAQITAINGDSAKPDADITTAEVASLQTMKTNYTNILSKAKNACVALPAAT